MALPSDPAPMPEESDPRKSSQQRSNGPHSIISHQIKRSLAPGRVPNELIKVQDQWQGEGRVGRRAGFGLEAACRGALGVPGLPAHGVGPPGVGNHQRAAAAASSCLVSPAFRHQEGLEGEGRLSASSFPPSGSGSGRGSPRRRADAEAREATVSPCATCPACSRGCIRRDVRPWRSFWGATRAPAPVA